MCPLFFLIGGGVFVERLAGGGFEPPTLGVARQGSLGNPIMDSMIALFDCEDAKSQEVGQKGPR